MSHRILVTGAGGPAGVVAIQEFQRLGHTVIGADMDDSAVGLRLADEAVGIPSSRHPDFVNELCAAARRAQVDTVLSTVAEELERLTTSLAQRLLHDAGLATWMPTPDAVGRCTDKLAWFVSLVDVAPVAMTSLRADIPGPWVVKPRSGRGSVGVHMFIDRRDVEEFLIDHPHEYVVQTRSSGREFSADAFVHSASSTNAVVLRWRSEVKAGISTKGETFEHRVATAAVIDALSAIELEGVSNTQGFVDGDGAVTLIETNPRCSGAMALSLHAGADLLGQWLRVAHGEPPERERLRYLSGMSMFRYHAARFEESPASRWIDAPIATAGRVGASR